MSRPRLRRSGAVVPESTTPRISPQGKFFIFNQVFTFSVEGGTAPYTWAIVSGPGAINAGTGEYTAPAAGASAVFIKVTDNLGVESSHIRCYVAATATITIVAPSDVEYDETMPAYETLALSASGGDPTTYNWTISVPHVDALSSINPSTGVYSFYDPEQIGSYVETVQVTDAFGNSDTQSVTVFKRLERTSAATASMVYGGTYQFNTNYGKSPAPRVIHSGPGSINGSGLFTAPSSGAAGPNGTLTTVLRCTDALGYYVEATMTITSNLALSPNTLQNMVTAGTLQFTGSGGVGPYVFTENGATSTITSPGGLLSGNGAADDITVTLTDAENFVRTCPVHISDALLMTPNTANVGLGATQQMTVIGGTPPYTYDKVSGEGSIDGSGLYTGPAVGAYGTGAAVVRVTDNVAATDTSAITLKPIVKSVRGDEIDGYVDFGNVFSKERNQAFSIEGWFKASNWSTNTTLVTKFSGSFRGMAFMMDSSVDATADVFFGLVNTYPTNMLAVKTDHVANPAEGVALNVWNHIAVTYDGSSNASGVKLYINGVRATEVIDDDTLTGTIVHSDSLQMVGNTTAPWYQNQYQTSTSCWNRVLTAGEVTALYNGGFPPVVTSLGFYNTTDCEIYVPMGTGDTYPTLTDVANGHDGTMTNMIAGDIVGVYP